MIDSNSTYFKVYLTRKAHLLAKDFSKKQKLSKTQQVYHNTLAVWAVAYYMKCMQIKTDWESSDSWDVIKQSLLDVADLVLPGIGILECRAFIKGEEKVYIPLDASLDRLAYVAIQLDASLEVATTATILGFIKSPFTKQELPTHKLQSLNQLLELIEQTKLFNLNNTSTKLSEWLEHEDTGDRWLPPTAVFKGTVRENLVSSVRNTKSLITKNSNRSSSTATRGKKINFGIQVEEQQVALIIEITTGTNENIDILARVEPIDSLRIPEGIELYIIDENNQIFKKAKARSKDNFIQLKFFGRIGERFSIKLALGDNSITEYFEI